MKGWELKRLDELGNVARGKSRHRPRNAAFLYGGRYPFIQTGDIESADFYINSYSQTYSEQGLKQSKLWSKGTLCISIVGANTGASAILRFDACFPDSVIGFIEDKDKSDIRFVKYALEILRIKLKSIAEGAARENLSLEKLLTVQIPTPPLSYQKKIASVLSAYDDLMENNRNRINLLEEIAQRTYEEWFVKFRINGEPLAVNKSTELPDGWEYVELGSLLIKLESGGRPKGGIDKDTTEGIPSIGAESVLGLGKYNFEKEKLVPTSFFKKMKRGIVGQKDILIYKDGAYIGRASMFQDGFPHEICSVNEHVFLLNTGNNAFQNFLFFTLSRPEYFMKMQALNSNSAQPGINQDKIKGLSVLKPTKEALNLFNDIVDPLTKIIFNLAKVNNRLKEARDILLPRLMSGEINVEEMELSTLTTN